jgi:hypothetical protein
MTVLCCVMFALRSVLCGLALGTMRTRQTCLVMQKSRPTMCSLVRRLSGGATTLVAGDTRHLKRQLLTLNNALALVHPSSGVSSAMKFNRLIDWTTNCSLCLCHSATASAQLWSNHRQRWGS